MSPRSLVTIVCCTAILFSSADLVAAEPSGVTLTSPAERQVFQRDRLASGEAIIAGTLRNGTKSLTYAIFSTSDHAKVASGEIPLTPGVAGFRHRVRVAAGGWYQLSLRAEGDGPFSETIVERFGVGELFVVAGQSNSANYGEAKLESADDRVVNFTGEQWQVARDPQPGAGGGGGSFIPPLGDALAAKLQVPIAFATCGSGGTSVRQWQPRGTVVAPITSSTAFLETISPDRWVCDGRLQETLSLKMKSLIDRGGFRAVLWHQGESDANQADPKRTLSGGEYVRLMRNLMAKCNRDCGGPSVWMIAQASYHNPSDTGSPEIREAQTTLWRDENVQAGPDSDSLTGAMRDHGGKGVHFSREGQIAHGRLWSEKLIAMIEKPQEKRLLYVVSPGIRNYLDYGPAGVHVFDIDRNHAYVRTISTPASREAKPDNIKGVCADAASKRLYFTTRSKLFALDLTTDALVWERELPGGTDRPSLRPDGAVIYVPTFEGDFWNVVDTKSGELITRIETKSGAHNTVASRDGRFMFLGGLKSPDLFMVDCVKHELVKRIGPLGGSIRPFTIDSATKRAYVCVNGLLGFEIAEIETGKLIHRVEVAGFKSGPVKRHGCPSHGVGLTPHEREVWVVDAFNERIHVFDNTVDPPRQMQSIPVRDQPGWITFSIDGRFAYSSTGEVIDTSTKRIVAALADEFGHPIHSEKVLEIDFREGEPIATGDQFGVGRASHR